jgi:hypothetical protein
MTDFSPFLFWIANAADFNEFSIYFAVVFIFLFISTSEAIKCYVCGHDADGPFLEAKSDYNETAINQIHNSCEEFDRIPLEEKYKYEMNCPNGYVGCMLNVGGL